jgi:hypothetical protein
MPTYTIRVQLQDDAPIHLRSAAAIVRIVDSTLADAPYHVLREHRFGDLRYDGGDRFLVVTDFRLGPQPKTRLWAVFVLVDVDGDGTASVGDFITMQSYPLSSTGGVVDVVAQRIHPVTA